MRNNNRSITLAELQYAKKNGIKTGNRKFDNSIDRVTKEEAEALAKKRAKKAWRALMSASHRRGNNSGEVIFMSRIEVLTLLVKEGRVAENENHENYLLAGFCNRNNAMYSLAKNRANAVRKAREFGKAIVITK